MTDLIRTFAATTRLRPQTSATAACAVILALASAVLSAPQAAAQGFDLLGKGVTLGDMAVRTRAEDNLRGDSDERTTERFQLTPRAGVLLLHQPPCNIDGVPSPRAIVFLRNRPNAGAYQCGPVRSGTASHFTDSTTRYRFTTKSTVSGNIVDLVARITSESKAEIHVAHEGRAQGSSSGVAEIRIRLRLERGGCRIIAFDWKIDLRASTTLPSGREHIVHVTRQATQAPESTCTLDP